MSEKPDEILQLISDALLANAEKDVLVHFLNALADALDLSADIRAEPRHSREIPHHAPELYRDRPDRSENAPDFIFRVYAPWLGGDLRRSDLYALDRPLYQAFQNWLRANKHPDWLDLPTVKEANDRLLAETCKGRASHPNLYASATRESRKQISLYHAARNRRKKETKQ